VTVGKKAAGAQASLDNAADGVKGEVVGTAGGAEPAKLSSPPLTRGQAARRLGCSTTHVARLEDSGSLPHEVDESSGEHYYRTEDVEALRERMGLDDVPARALQQGTEGGSHLTLQLVTQLMGHTDRSTKNTLATQEVILRALEKSYARINYLEDELAKCFDLLKTLGDSQHEKNLQLAQAGAEQERKDKGLNFAMEKFSTLWPILQVKLFGLPINKGEHPGWDALQKFLDSLKPEQMQALLGSLGQDQMALFKTLVDLLTTPEKKPETPAT